MKKLTYFMMAAAGLVLASCANEDLANPANGDTANVSINLSTPQISTRDYSDGTTAQKLQYAVYLVNKDKSLSKLDELSKVDGQDFYLKDNIPLKLANGRSYAFVFWAESADDDKGESTNPYDVTFTDGGATMTINNTSGYYLRTNDENLDAFYAYKEITVSGDTQVDIPLYRPFAQINVGTNDYVEAKAAGYEPTKSKINVSFVNEGFDLVNKKLIGGRAQRNYLWEAIPTESYPVDGYDYLAMAYVLVPQEKSTLTVTFLHLEKDESDAQTRTITNVPVQANHRTNIYGQLLTSNADLNVHIEPMYEEPDYDKYVVAPGVEFNAELQTFTVNSAEGLKWISDQVNGYGFHKDVATETHVYGGNYLSFVGQTVVLANDIDFASVENFTPIGYEVNSKDASIYSFAGTFDGNNKTIKNLKVQTEKSNNAGLFGSLNEATVKNLTIDKADVNGHYKTGALAGDAWNTKIDNVVVKNSKVTSTPWEKQPNVYDDANNVGGIVGYLNAYPYETSLTNSKVIETKVTAFRKVAGIVGAIGIATDNVEDVPSLTIKGNSLENVVVTADMTETRYDGYAKREAMTGAIYATTSLPSNLMDKVDLQENEEVPGVEFVVIKGIAPDQTLAEAIAGAKEGETIAIPAGTYEEFPASSMKKGVTVVCEEGTVFDGQSSPDLKGGTIKGATFRHTTGNASSEGAIKGQLDGTFEDCTFEGNNGARWTYLKSEDTKFINCKFSGTAIYAFHVDSANGSLEDPTLRFEGCVFDGFVAIGSSVKTIFDQCQFLINSRSRYGGGNFWGPTVFNKCHFDLPNPEENFRYIALATSGYVFEFNNCTLRNSDLTIDYDFPAATPGVIIRVDGSEKTK